MKNGTGLSKPVDEANFSWKKVQEITGHETLWDRDSGQILRVHNDWTFESALGRLYDGGYVVDVNLRFCLPEARPQSRLITITFYPASAGILEPPTPR